MLGILSPLWETLKKEFLDSLCDQSKYVYVLVRAQRLMPSIADCSELIVERFVGENEKTTQTPSWAFARTGVCTRTITPTPTGLILWRHSADPQAYRWVWVWGAWWSARANRLVGHQRWSPGSVELLSGLIRAYRAGKPLPKMYLCAGFWIARLLLACMVGLVALAIDSRWPLDPLAALLVGYVSSILLQRLPSRRLIKKVVDLLLS
jgi:hypothetical protein